MKVKAICAEAVTAMGAIRAAARTYYIEYNAYPGDYLSYGQLDTLGIKGDELNGTYFSKECYNYEPIDGGFRITCYPAQSQASRKDEALAIVASSGSCAISLALNFLDIRAAYASVAPPCLVMYHTGKIKQYGIPRSGYPEDDRTP